MKKKVVVVLLCVAMATTMLAGCGSSSDSSFDDTAEETTEEIEEATTEEDGTRIEYVVDNSSSTIDMDAYRQEVGEQYDYITSIVSLMSLIGEYEATYWDVSNNIVGRVDLDTLYQKALEAGSEGADYDAEDLSTLIDTYYDSITLGYEELSSVMTSGTEVEVIGEKYLEVYEAYINLYFLVTEPSGTYENFAANLSKYENIISNAEGTLGILVSDDEESTDE